MGGHSGSKGAFQEEQDNKPSVTGCVWKIDRSAFVLSHIQHLNVNKESRSPSSHSVFTSIPRQKLLNPADCENPMYCYHIITSSIVCMDLPFLVALTKRR